MTEHIVSSYDEDLKEISDGLTDMGNEVLGALKNVENILKNNDHKLAKETIKNDLKINDILVEAGGIFLSNLLKNDLVDEIHLFLG